MPPEPLYGTINYTTGELSAPAPRTQYAFDGRKYLMCAKNTDTPMRNLDLSATEWSIIEYMQDSGGASGPVKTSSGALADELGATETTAKRCLSRLVRMNILLKTSQRSGAYQLNPRRWWEGTGRAQVEACARLNAPPIKPDPKATKKMNSIKAMRSDEDE